MTPYLLGILDMTCEHCAQSLKKSLESIPGIREAAVSWKEGWARVKSERELEIGAFEEAVDSAGFRLSSVVVEGKDTDSGSGQKTGPWSSSGSPKKHILIIGTGSSACAAAIEAAERGARVTMVEQGTLGGTCVNVGCIPSKALIMAAKVFHVAENHPFRGIGQMSLWKDAEEILHQRTGLVEMLRKAKYADILDSFPDLRVISGVARFKDPRTVAIVGPDGNPSLLEADAFIIATGSSAVIPAIQGLSETPYWTSTEALNSPEIPQSMIVLGGGPIGIEIGQSFQRMGTRVTLITERFLPREDPDISEALMVALREEKMDVIADADIRSVRCDGGNFHVTLKDQVLVSERLLVSAGRAPNTGGLGLDRAGVGTTAEGAIVVDERLRTSTPHIYAAGDCTPLPKYVYLAAKSGKIAAMNILGDSETLNWSILPSVVFSDPEVASVGLTEDEARQANPHAESRTLSLSDVPRALVSFNTAGFVKLVADVQTGQLLGAHILAPAAGELAQMAALAMHSRITVRQLGDMLFPYLTMGEALKLCAQKFYRDVGKLSCCAG